MISATFANARADAGSFSWTRGRGADRCISRAQIAAELSSALGRPIEQALEGRALDVLLEREGAGWTASLFWRASDGTSAGTRIVHDSSIDCDGITRAARTSVLVALGADAVDVAHTSPAPPASSSPAPPSSGPPAVASSTPSGSSEPPLVSSPPPHTPRRNAIIVPGDVMLGGLIAIGWFPVPAYGVQLVAEPIVYGRFRLGILASALAESTATFGSTNVGFSAVEFGIDTCGSVVRFATWIEAIACIGARAGATQAFVYGNPQIAGGAQGAFAAEMTGMLRLTPVGPAVLEIGAIGRVNFTQYALTRVGDPGAPPLYTQSIGTFVTTIRLGVHF